jgi:diguanylate cyclase (GGDEF)-like protein
MGLNTCLLLWLDGRGDRLRILECVSDESDNITRRKIEKREGVVGAVLQSRAPVALKGLRPGYPGIPYYEAGARVTDFLGVPVAEGAALRGVLCADRIGGRPFDKVEEENLVAAVESILRTVSNERIFTQLQKAKSEQGKLLGASGALARALAEDDVVDAALEAASEIATYDVAAVSLEDKRGRQVIRKALGEDAEQLEGVAVSGSSSLAAAAFKNRHFLPYRGEFDPKQQVLFTKAVQKVFQRMRSALVLPLICGDQPVGTLTLATATPGAYDEEVRTTLQVMTNQLGTALQNARMVRRLEELATTDGLTGLPNHRVFQEELDRQLATAVRFNKEMSVILCDVDHFKKVNDTHGHPVGDVVLKGLGETLRRNVVRDTDLPARYGGEEFAIVCAGTGTAGATKLAERIRKDLEGQTFHSDKGDFQVTISIGVATFPHHARERETLVERSDIALYTAKESGRNRVVVWKKDLKKK